ncbi:MAG: response regulator [Chloroflexales bacterium]|nr:response regulator [Chloroflexales bacterium]
MAQRILVVDDSPMNLKVVSASLAPAGYELITAQNGREALERAETGQPDLIILDVQMPEMNGYEVCRRLRRNPTFSTRPIMMLTANNSLEERVHGLEAGADDYMSKPFETAELQARVKALLRRFVPVTGIEPAGVRGKTIALFSLRGGMGVSSIATNVAVGLAQIWGGQTVLVDMSFLSGQSALLLNLPLRTTWGDLASKSTEEIDADLLERVLLNHPSGVRVLAAASRPEQSELISSEKVASVIGVLRDRFSYVVLDMPHNFSDPTLACLDAADQIMLVLAPEIASVCATACTLDVFDQIGYSREKVTLVLNNPFERGGLARKDIEATLKQPIITVLPYGGDTFLSALNRGMPPVLEHPTKPLGAMLEDWAFALSSEEHRKKRPERPSPALQRVAQRAQQRHKTKG